MQILGIIFLSLILGILGVFIDSFYIGDYLSFFIKEQALNLAGMLIGLSLTGVIFLLGQLTSIEVAKGVNFTNSKNELKQNINFMFGAFIMLFFTLLIKVPDNCINYMIIWKSVVLCIIFLILYAVFEITQTIFTINK